MRHLSTRLQSLNYKKTLHYINHDFRIDYTSHIKNNNQNYFYIPSENKQQINKYKYSKIKQNKNKKEFLHIKNKVDEITKKHKEIYFKNHKRNLRTERTNSINRGILTFPKDLENDLKGESFDKKEFIEMGVKTILNICKELDIELIYITRHFDETTPHFHYLTSNYNTKGNVITRNREIGKKLQDISEIYFKKFGISRGVSKEATGNRNLKNEIDKLKNQLKEEKNKNKEIKKENIKLQEENKELKNQNEELIKNILINQTEYNKLLTDVKSLKDEYIKYSEDVETKKEFYKSVLNPLLKNLQEIEKDYKLFNSKTLVQTLTDEQLKQRINKINNTFKSVKENIESPKFQNVKKQLEDYCGFSM